MARFVWFTLSKRLLSARQCVCYMACCENAFFLSICIIVDCLTRELSQRPTGDPERRRRQLTEMWRQDIRYIHTGSFHVGMQHLRTYFAVLTLHIFQRTYSRYVADFPPI